jgi:hypothetical protein
MGKAVGDVVGTSGQELEIIAISWHAAGPQDIANKRGELDLRSGERTAGPVVLENSLSGSVCDRRS